jgi:hypothetical protein
MAGRTLVDGRLRKAECESEIWTRPVRGPFQGLALIVLEPEMRAEEPFLMLRKDMFEIVPC